MYKCEHKFYEKINNIMGSYYNHKAGSSNELRYVMIKHNRKEKIFIIIDRNRTMIYDPSVGLLDLEALILKDKPESDEIYKLIA